MLQYFFKRLFLMIPTLFGIMLLNFIIIQAAPGGPIQQILAKVRGESSDLDTRFGGNDGLAQAHSVSDSAYTGAAGLDPAFIKDLERQFGFDKPAHIRFLIMIKNYLKCDFGESYFKNQKVSTLILEKLPVSISLGLWTMFLVHLISIPLGIRKAIHHGTSFDLWTSGIVVVAYAVPSFLFALLLINLFAGGGLFELFPLRGLLSTDNQDYTLWQHIKDYVWHLTLPITAMVMSGFAKLTFLTKNSFLEEINKQYVLTARAKGISQNRMLYGHIFRNALLVVVAGFPSSFIAVLFTSSLLIEVLFSLDGLGLLGFEAALCRDYPVMFGCLFVFTVLGMLLHLIGDFCTMAMDKRIDLSQNKK